MAYSDIFDYPLKAWEIHKWLIGKKANLKQVEKFLQKLLFNKSINFSKGYYFLKKRQQIVNKRLDNFQSSKKHINRLKVILIFLKLIPTIKLIGLSGGLSLMNASKKDDIDLFVITTKNRLWLTRFLILSLLDLLGVRRKKGDSKLKSAGKICTNILLEEDKIKQGKKDIFLAHEILQMKVLFQKDNIYTKYLEQNNWVFKYLPNWKSSESIMFKDYHLRAKESKNSLPVNFKLLIDLVENLSKLFQLKYMGEAIGEERVENGAVYFLPNDYRNSVLNIFNKKIKKLFLNPTPASFSSVRKKQLSKAKISKA